MATAELSPETVIVEKTLRDPEFVSRLQKLRQVDNFTNLFYLAATWVILLGLIGGAVVFAEWTIAAGVSLWWNVPVFALVILGVGAGQHQLTGLAHEASHHTLLKHRMLNDLVSDWFCMFPMFSSTHHYRLQHMAHHQFVNDPDRDPDVSQLKTSGHWLKFPLAKHELIRELIKQLQPTRLIKYIRIRAKYNSVGTDKNPYMKKGYKPRKLALRFGLAYLLGMVAVLTGLVTLGNPWLLAVVPAAMWAAAVIFYYRLPQEYYHQSKVRPVVPSRWMTIGRITFLTGVFTALAWTTQLTGRWASIYFALLWVVPLFTSFSLFMILRQLVQHGNGDRGWLTNTRVFFVHPLIRYAVFPMGQDYHLPHHMYATVPHYKLDDLHKLLLEYPEYREEAIVVEGYFLPMHRPPTAPTVLDVLGPEYRPHTEEIYVDDTVLEDEEVEDKQTILKEGERLRRHEIT